jgi:hypothetical protein
LIPSSLWGVVLFVVLLAPGLAYVLRHERVVPARSHTTFRESLRVVFVSVACLTATGLLAAGIRATLPERTPNFRALILNPGGYWRGHHVQLAWWAFAFVVFATVLGAAAADRRVVRFAHWLARKPAIRWITGATDTDISSASAWYRVMHMFDEGAPRPKPPRNPPGPIFVGAAMDDGTYIEGRMVTFNVAADENADREMLLSAPLHFTMQNGERFAFAGQFTVISARHIVRLDVTHINPALAAAPRQSAPGEPENAEQPAPAQRDRAKAAESRANAPPSP